MHLLPRSCWTIRLIGDVVIVGAHEVNGYRHYSKFSVADLPNELVTMDDLRVLRASA